MPSAFSKSTHLFAVGHVLIRTPLGLPDDSHRENPPQGYLSSVLTVSRRHQDSCREMCVVCVLSQRQQREQACKMNAASSSWMLKAFQKAEEPQTVHVFTVGCMNPVSVS